MVKFAVIVALETVEEVLGYLESMEPHLEIVEWMKNVFRLDSLELKIKFLKKLATEFVKWILFLFYFGNFLHAMD